LSESPFFATIPFYVIVEAPEHVRGLERRKKGAPDIGLLRPETPFQARGLSLSFAMLNCVYREGVITSEEGERCLGYITSTYHDLLVTHGDQPADGRTISRIMKRIMREVCAADMDFDRLDFRHSDELASEMSHAHRRGHPLIVRHHSEGSLLLPSDKKDHGILIHAEALFDPSLAKPVELRDEARKVTKGGGSIRLLKRFERIETVPLHVS
jgi:hypothetical protein